MSFHQYKVRSKKSMPKAVVSSQEQVKWYEHKSDRTLAFLSLNESEGTVQIIDAGGIRILSLTRKV